MQEAKAMARNDTEFGVVVSGKKLINVNPLGLYTYVDKMEVSFHFFDQVEYVLT